MEAKALGPMEMDRDLAGGRFALVRESEPRKEGVPSRGFSDPFVLGLALAEDKCFEALERRTGTNYGSRQPRSEAASVA